MTKKKNSKYTERIAIHVKKINRNINDFGYAITFKKILLTLIYPIYESKEMLLYEIDLQQRLKVTKATDSVTYKVLNKHDKSYTNK